MFKSLLRKRNIGKGFAHAKKEHSMERYCTITLVLTFLFLVFRFYVDDGSIRVLIGFIGMLVFIALVFRALAGYHHKWEKHHLDDMRRGKK